jgi:hypothetical protein
MLSWPLLRENNETFHEAFVLVAWDMQMPTWECSVADVLHSTLSGGSH